MLLAVNLLNYLDRQIVYVLLPLIKADLSPTDTQLGALASAFMLVYMCAAPPIGYLADRTSRRAWIGGGVAGWSLATMLSGLAPSYPWLFAARSAVGIGESCYGSVSPSFVAEHFPRERRGWALALFSMAIPVGSALGYILGGVLGLRWGWRQACLLAGLPGFILAWLAWRLKDPREEGAGGGGPHEPPTWKEYLGLARNRSLASCTLAMAAMTFGLGAFAVWMPSFYTRAWGLNVSEAGTLFGVRTVIAGVVGSLAGGWIADRLLKRTPKAYFLVSAAGLLAALPLGWLTVTTASLPLSTTALTLAEIGCFLNMGPLNAQIVAVTPPRVRSMAFAANIFVIHLLGDAISPTIVGWISDTAGLRAGLIVATAALGVAGLICLAGTRFVREDARRVFEGEPHYA